MTTTQIDKSSWPAGPWTSEPDRVEWTHAGYPCLILRNPALGTLFGWVGVDPMHPWYGRDWDIFAEQLTAHQGITYAQAPDDFVALTKPAVDVWLIGFDCAHAFDVAPAMCHYDFSPNALTHYRTLEYVTAQTEGLAEQLRAVATAAAAPPSNNPV